MGESDGINPPRIPPGLSSTCTGISASRKAQATRSNSSASFPVHRSRDGFTNASFEYKERTRTAWHEGQIVAFSPYSARHRMQYFTDQPPAARMEHPSDLIPFTN